jgi:hypothetical protein
MGGIQPDVIRIDARQTRLVKQFPSAAMEIAASLRQQATRFAFGVTFIVMAGPVPIGIRISI